MRRAVIAPAVVAVDRAPSRASAPHFNQLRGAPEPSASYGVPALTRLTNGFSKRADYHLAAVGLFVAHFIFCRVHEALSRHARYGAAADGSRLDDRRATDGLSRKNAP